ncbi:MAG: glycosyltransferase family 2 protein [Gammaproteobacteria bacterium]|nr:glycosyltransferase family 2 protein [Gammaproteobacteria bacterium]
MQLSIITVNYRSWKHLENLLSDLIAAPEVADRQWELIVVDNDSADGNLEQFSARFKDVRFVANKGNFGFAHGNNLGASHAAGEALLFINPDVRADPDSVRQLIQTGKAHPEVALLTALQVDAKGRPQKAFDRFPNLLTYVRTIRSLAGLHRRSDLDPNARGDELIHCDWISGSLLLIDHICFDELGGWCEDFWMYAEDMDLSRTAQDKGMLRACSRSCVFVHLHGGASRRDGPTTLLTKTEVMISAHVYIARHFSGLHQWANHTIVLMRNLVPLAMSALLSVVTLGLAGGLRLRAKLFIRITAYYYSALKTGTWLSPRSVNYAPRLRAR